MQIHWCSYNSTSEVYVEIHPVYNIDMSKNLEIFPGVPYELAENFIEDLSSLSQVEMIIATTNRNNEPTIVTVISALPFEFSPRSEVYGVQAHLIQQTPGILPFNFRLYNLRELLGGEQTLEYHLSQEFAGKFKILYRRR